MGSCIPSTAATATSASPGPSLRKTHASLPETHSPRGSSGPRTHADLKDHDESKKRSKPRTVKSIKLKKGNCFTVPDICHSTVSLLNAQENSWNLVLLLEDFCLQATLKRVHKKDAALNGPPMV